MTAHESNPRSALASLRRHLYARKLLLILLLPWPVLLLACKREDPNAVFGSSVTPMDHDPSDTFVRNVYIDGTWVGSAGTGGSTVGTGIILPMKWRPGLTATVRWERCDRFIPEHPVPDEQACRWTEKEVPIHPYGDVGRTWLHLMPNDEVLIIPSMMGPSNPDYPGPGYPEKDFFNLKDDPRLHE